METPVQSKLNFSQHWAFKVARQAAEQALKRRFRLLRLVRTGAGKLFSERAALGQTKDDLLVLLRLARAWARKEYRSLPWRSMLYAVAGIAYFINPVDLIPDFLVGIGFADDIAVIMAIGNALRKDLDAFLEWEKKQLKP